MNTLTNESVLENEQILRGIEARQQSLGRLSSYLSELESQLALIFAASPDIIVFLDENSNIIRISDAAYTLLGYKREEMTGKCLWDFLSIADVEQAKQHLTDVKEQKFISFEARRYLINYWVAKNGTLVKLAWRFSLYDERENQTIGVATDVSYLGQNERLNIKLLDRAINLATDGIVITDACSSDNSIVYVNPAFEKITGYEKQEIIGKNCRFLQSENCIHSRALNVLRKCVQSFQGCSVLLENKRKDGSLFYNHLTISTVVENGITTNFIGISQDVTDKIGVDFEWSPNTERGFVAIL
jgi:PAS domain S-box-containing protein